MGEPKKYTFVVHDESVNTHGFRMLTSGANMEEFNKNPVILYNHDDWDFPIGKGENMRKEGTRILVDVIFDEADERSAKVQGKVERGFMRMASIGAWPPEEVSNDPALKLPGQELPTVTKWTVREVSICSIGSNHNALVFYDRKTEQRIDLTDTSLIKLMDSKPNINHKKEKNMSYLTGLLKLSDSASETAIQEAVQGLIKNKDDLQTENTQLKATNQTLQTKVDGFERKEKEVRSAEAIKLVDAAIKDGRIDAKGKESWLEDFKDNFEKASVRLSSISSRGTVADKIQTGDVGKGTIALRDLTFKEILKQDKLRELKKEPELYREKFYEEYGKYPE